ncbi:SusC/RagA family TonB-linked outer membrane protein [Ravibacter arvi]
MRASLLLLMVFFATHCWAQERQISGRVLDESNNPIPGANIMAKGTSIGTSTNAEGVFSINMPANTKTITVSSVGYTSQEINLTGAISQLEIRLLPDVKQLGEVVVTALGVEQKTRNVGFAVQQIGGGAIQEAREVNFVNALQGKLAGVQIGGNSGSMGGSSRVTIRGLKSISGNNNALFIVDGVPLANMNLNTVSTTGGQGTGGGGYDFGNPAQLLNPNDVENISVLKGAAATALYGSRGQNGVIYITTKTGKGSGKLSVNYDFNFQADQISYLPEFQNRYGGGGSDKFTKLYYNEHPEGFLPGGGTFDDNDGKGRYDLIPDYGTDESWGPKLDGTPVRHYWSWDQDRNNPYFGQSAPWAASPDNAKDFFKTGITFSNNLSVASSSDRGSIRFSLGNTKQNFIYPGSELKRFFMSLNTSYKFTDKFTFSGGINYVNDHSRGRPGTGFHGNNPMLFFIMYGQRQIDDFHLRQYKYADGTEQSWNRTAWNIQKPAFTQNPYWNQYENYNTDNNNRYFGNAGLTYQLTNWLSADMRVYSDFLTHLDEIRAAKGFFVGSYERRNMTNRENNYQLTLNAKANLGDSKFSLDGVAGGNIMEIKNSVDRGVTAGGLQNPNVYVLQNSVTPATITNSFANKQINSLFASASFGYNELLYLTLTGRNDWASSLYQTGNYSYFYPSTALSFIFSELLPGANWLTLGKARLSYARVGNDADPYTVSRYYDYVVPFGSYPLQSTADKLFNNRLKPEQSAEVEGGVDLKFFGERLGLSATYYDRKTKNQIWDVSIPAESGFSTKVVNGGTIQNRGLELSLSAMPVATADFSWRAVLNFSKNVNKVLNLNSTSDDVKAPDNYIIGRERRTQKVSMVAWPGRSLGTMMGTDYVYHANGGRIVGANGTYDVTAAPVIIGDALPDFIGGFANTFSYKGLYLSALIDFQKGGDFFSYTNLYGNKSGMFKETAEGDIRENGLVVPGVNAEGQPNSVSVTARTHFNANGGNRISKANLYDGSYIYLREVRLGYELPQAIAEKIKTQAIRLTLTGRNLWLIKSNSPNVDPANITNSIGNQIGFEGGALPPVRSMGLNLNVTF